MNNKLLDALTALVTGAIASAINASIYILAFDQPVGRSILAWVIAGAIIAGALYLALRYDSAVDRWYTAANVPKNRSSSPRRRVEGH